MLTGIVALGKDGAIGHKGKIPWKIPEEMSFFRKTTYGSAVVMGRKTYDSIGKPLDHRFNVVMSKEGFVHGLVTKVETTEEVLNLSSQMNTFIIGGTAIYTLFSKQITHWIVSHIPIDCG